MATEEQTTESTEQTPEMSAEMADAFAAGFDEDEGSAPAASAAATKPATDAEEHDEGETGTVEGEQSTEGETPPAAVSLTQEQLDRLMKAAELVESLKQGTDEQIRKLNGKFGEVGSVLKQLQQTRTGTPLALKKESFKRLTDEFPAMAELLAEDLSEALAQAAAAPAPAQPVLDSETLLQMLKPTLDDTFSNVLSASEQTLELRLLKRAHPDWREWAGAVPPEEMNKLPEARRGEIKAKAQEFAKWKTEVLPPETAAALDESWDADFVASQMDAFHKWRKAKLEKSKEHQRRLEAAVAPTSDRRTPGKGQSDIAAAFAEGFES